MPGAGPEGVDPRVFHDIYEGEAPWDLGEPQREVVRLLEADAFRSPVLDVGCGTGENAMLLALARFEVTAIDLVPAAVETAREEAAARAIDVDWRWGDALHLADALPGRRFRTVLDSGVFHVFGDRDRARYVDQLRRVTEPAGLVHVIVFRDDEPGDDGPRRVSRAELEAAFSDGWQPLGIDATHYGLRGRGPGARAWRGTWRREGHAARHEVDWG